MDKERLEERLDGLTQDRERLQQDYSKLERQLQEGQAGLAQIANNINAFNGAIQETERWLSVLDSPPVPVTLVPSPGQEDGSNDPGAPIPGRVKELKAGDEMDGETMEKVPPSPLKSPSAVPPDDK